VAEYCTCKADFRAHHPIQDDRFRYTESGNDAWLHSCMKPTLGNWQNHLRDCILCDKEISNPYAPADGNSQPYPSWSAAAAAEMSPI
jgi:hypothetical protein